MVPISLNNSVADGQLTGEEIRRLVLTRDEIETILGDQLIYTLSPANMALAEKMFPSLSPAEAYKRRIAQINGNRARLKLSLQNTDLDYLVKQMYRTVRGFNPVHFLTESGLVVATGYEPVLQEKRERYKAAIEMVLYIALLKGTSWALGTLKGAAVAPHYSGAGDVIINFPSGGTLTIKAGASPRLNPKIGARLVEKASRGEHAVLTKMRPAKRLQNSLLNDLTFPPNIKNNREFGEFIKWSEESTVSSAIRYTNNQIKGLNSQKLNDLRQSGMTKEIAEKWANFYQVESVLTDTNPNAYARYLLMKALAEKL